MYLHWLLYRESEEMCTNQQTEIAITVQITENIVPMDDDASYDDNSYYYDDNGDDDFQLFSWASWHLEDENNKVVYSSTKDYLPIFINFEFQDTVFVDLCLPRNLAYKFVYQDKNQISENPVALIEVVQDGQVLARKEGDIGTWFVVNIPASDTPSYPKGKYSLFHEPQSRLFSRLLILHVCAQV